MRKRQTNRDRVKDREKVERRTNTEAQRYKDTSRRRKIKIER